MPPTGNAMTDGGRATARPIIVANCSGFFGDRLSAAREQVEGGPIDVLTGDWLAEVTMFVLARTRRRRPDGGWARTFLRQMEEVLGRCVRDGIKVVSNAGGLNPIGCAEALSALADQLGVDARIAVVEGDDLMPRLDEFREPGLRHLESGEDLLARGVQPDTANAYLGGLGIAEALARGADVVVTGRVADAALVVGPSVWWHGWAADDWDRLAGAVVAGHVLECGAQATGGNYPFFHEVPGIERCGFPLAEVHADGSSIITKHPGTGGLVSVGTVTAQLLYEIEDPRYRTPDVTARFDTVRLEQEAPDRVRASGARGEPPPPTTKVAVTYADGFWNSATIVLGGLDVEEKAEIVQRTLWQALPGGRDSFRDASVELIRTDQPDPQRSEQALASLRVTVADHDEATVGRRFSNAVTEMALATVPGFFLTAPPRDAAPYERYWPATVPREMVRQTVLLDGARYAVEEPPGGGAASVRVPRARLPAPPGGPTRRAPLGQVLGARSGDKGGNANLGIWARDPASFAWARRTLTAGRLRRLLPETAGCRIARFELPNLLALNFVVYGLLGEGAISSSRIDPQAKALAETFRARETEIPVALLDAAARA